MAARAIWKGIIVVGEERVPVKLYSAVNDRSVHFRLLHRADRAPVRQVLVNPHTEEAVDYDQSRRAYADNKGRAVLFEQQELASLEPKKSRDIETLGFLPMGAIDHRWYDRPYYLGPDGEHGNLDALAAALERSNREGLARWVMRGKEYLGALRLNQGHPMLVTLRHTGEVVAMDELSAPKGDALDKKELNMACQLIDMLAADFEPRAYHDEYRERVLELVETKQRGGAVKAPKVRRRKPSDDLSKALEASLKRERKGA